MNETLNVIAERYSCRNFKPDPLSGETLHAIAKAAVQAPSGMNRQAWRVIVVKNKALIEEMDALGMEKLKAWEDKSFYNRMMERGGTLFYGATAMVVIALDGKQPSEVDCGILCQTVALAATSLGIANVICGLARVVFEGARGEEFKKRLHFPEGYTFGCSVLLGYANTKKAPHEPDMNKIIVVE
ncbi:MAG: nitroreductase [Clostridiaceae bacterium]|nr:nitroreductase [Eubacteriales bacterium]